MEFNNYKIQKCLIFFILFCSVNVVSQRNLNFTKKETKEFNKFFEKGIKRDVDEHNDIIWFNSKRVDVLREDNLFDKPSTKMEIYFGMYKNGDEIVMTPLHIKNFFYASDWIFFKKISIIYRTLKEKRKGVKEKFVLYDDDVKREVKGSRISEVSDVIVSDEILDFLQKMCKDPKPIRIRYSGDDKYYEGYTGVFLKRFRKKLSPLLNSYLKLKSHLKSKTKK